MHRVLAEQLELIVDELLPEATVGPDDGPARLSPCMGVQQGHGVVLHEVGKAEGSRAAHASGTVQQCAAPLHLHTVDVVGYGVKEVTETRGGCVSHRHLHVLDVLVYGVYHLHRDIDDGGDLVAGEHELIVGSHPVADIQAAGNLGEATNRRLLELNREGTRGCCHRAGRSAAREA